jgi:hypothetical protein
MGCRQGVTGVSKEQAQEAGGGGPHPQMFHDFIPLRYLSATPSIGLFSVRDFSIENTRPTIQTEISIFDFADSRVS